MPRTRRAWRLAQAFATCAALFCAPAFGWGHAGHQTVALVAEQALQPATRAALAQLLSLEPGQTLSSLSTWADEHRSPQTAAWHYVNFPRGDCHYQPARDCPDGQCVVAAIERATGILASDAPSEKRLNALKYLVHLVADVHQPLHAGYQDDRGGNRTQIQAFGRGSQLHALWDSGLLHALGQEPAALAEELKQAVANAPDTPPFAQPSAPALAWSAAEAAEESCRIVGQPGFYPARRVDEAYLQRFAPVLKARLALAGARLAELLNRVLR